MDKPKLHEDEEQEKIFLWADLYKFKYPDLNKLFHVPNGGKRDVRVARKLKLQGVRPGVPDLCLPVAHGRYHGLFIELKVKGNKPTQLQQERLVELKKDGYCAVVCYGCEDAQRTLIHYIQLGDFCK